MKLWLVVILFLAQQVAFATGGEKSIEEYKIDLAKIEKSIEVTRKKMKEVRDVSFVPDLYFVLAELYSDKGKYLYLINTKENSKKKPDEVDFSDSTKAKKQAIEVYQRFIENFPKHENLDKAYFFMAHEYRELGQNEDMVKTYRRLTLLFPKSIFWEESQLFLGDFFLDQKKDFETAREFYEKILNRPKNPFMANARYKMGWCYINENKFFDALISFEKVITVDSKISLENLPDFYKKKDIFRDALVALVWPYSEQKKLSPERADALKYFDGLILDRGTMNVVLNKLAKRLMLKAKFDDAVPVYIRLIEITNDLDTRISVLDGFYEAFKKSKKIWPLGGLPEEFAKTLIRVRYSPAIATKDKAKIEKNFEIYIRDLATSLQSKAKSKQSVTDYNLAIAGYEVYLNTFKNSRYTSVMTLNQAESYFAIKRYADAGYKYEQLVRNKASARKDYFDSAIQSYALVLKNPEPFSKLERIEAREGFREVGAQFVKNYPNDKANAMIQFNTARTFYDERDFDKAVQNFKSFINRYPNHKESTAAGQLILDSFNQREDYEGLIKAGKELIVSSKISNSQFKQDVSEIVKQAEYRRLQDQVGDPKSREYAKKLLSFAAKYQGTSLGDQALYEAFVSFKKKKDPQAYEPGEQLLVKHADSKYAKEVVGAMGEMALNTADYKRAAKYFETFARKYPADPLAKDLMKNAASMRELMGDYKEAAENYQTVGMADKVSEQYLLSQDWSNLKSSLKSTSGIKNNYLLGLSLYRLGSLDQAKPYLATVSKSKANSSDEKTMAAHALYLMAGLDLKAYQSIKLGSGDEAGLVKAKQERLAKLTQQMNTVIGFGNGRWTIAGLYELGRAHKEFAQFLQSASTPDGLDAAQKKQYQNLIAQQVDQFNKKANEFFKSCTMNAEKFEVFTNFVGGCRSLGITQIDESTEVQIKAKATERIPIGVDVIRKKLFDAKNNVTLLMKLQQSYLGAQDYAISRLIASRVLELNSKNAEAQAQIGLSFLFMNDYELAATAFKQALKMSANNAVAVFGLAAIYKQFGFKSKYKTFSVRLKSVNKPKTIIHPWMTGL